MPSGSGSPPYETIENRTQQDAGTDSELSDAPDTISTLSEAEEYTRFLSSGGSERGILTEPDVQVKGVEQVEKEALVRSKDHSAGAHLQQLNRHPHNHHHQEEQELQVEQPAQAEQNHDSFSRGTTTHGLERTDSLQDINRGQASESLPAPLCHETSPGSQPQQPMDPSAFVSASPDHVTKSYDAPVPRKVRASRVSKSTSTLTPPDRHTLSVTRRRSGRLRRTPVRFENLIYENTSPDSQSESKSTLRLEYPSSSRSTSPSPTLRLKLRSDLLRQLSKSRTAIPDMPSPGRGAGKRKGAPSNQDTTPKKRVQNQHTQTESSQPSSSLSALPDSVLVSHPQPITGTEEFFLSVPKHGATENYLWDVAEQLKAASPYGGAKPEPSGQPPIWAARRTDLCETLPYFRSFKSGSYCTGGLAYGYLYNNFAFERDFMDASVTISRAGGGMGKDGKAERSSDHEVKKNTKDLMNNMRQHQPVVHITGNDNPCLPSQAPREYCVLGHYKITHIWMEKTLEGSTRRNILRYRFEKLKSGGEEIWWQPKGTTEVAPRGSLPPPVTHGCTTCNNTSEQVYLQGWMCLNEKCEQHWKLVTASGGLRDPVESSLVLDPRFLKQKAAPWSTENHTFDLMPYAVPMNEDMSAHSLYNVHAWKGMVCPRCARCISRVGFSGWKCDTLGCGFEKIPPRKAISAKSMREVNHHVRNSYPRARDSIFGNTIEEGPIHAYNYTIKSYRLPGVKAFVTHMVPNDNALTEPGGPDDMFEELQLTDVGLERRINGPITNKAASLTRHMNINSGMPYKFGAANINRNVSFDSSPVACIPNARSRLNWAKEFVFAMNRGQEVEGDGEDSNAEQFNELLTLGYFEDQSIDYHDDGEKGLGPTIATLSLGSPASFKLRMKHTPNNGATAGGLYYHEHPPIPGCEKYEERNAAHERIMQNVPKTNTTAYFKQCATDLGLKGGKAGKPLLDLTLVHGSILIMHGSVLQDCFEHSVSHTGILRFAMTCQYIDPGSVPDGIIDYTVGPDRIGYDGTKLSIPRDHLGNPIGDIFGKWDTDRTETAAETEE